MVGGSLSVHRAIMCTHLSSGRLARNVFKHHVPSTSCNTSVYTQSISAAKVLSPASNQVVLPFHLKVRHLNNHRTRFPRSGVIVVTAEVQEASVTRKMEVASLQPAVSKRIQATDDPCIVQMREMLRGSTDVISLAQGIVHWQPPARALERAKEVVFEAQTSGYGADDGLPELREALKEKLRTENGLTNSEVMVTAGANQAFANVVLALCDASDTVALFVPYYFNHLMAFQMTGITNILLGRSDPETFYPDLGWLEEALSGRTRPKPKLVVVTTPNNPTGVVIPGDHLRRLSEMCKKAGVWLVVDNTYEYFVYGDHKHESMEGDHIVNIYSFSKAYGMMGWRIGYIAYPGGVSGLGKQLLKAQDTIPVCPAIISQQLALASLQEAGRPWVHEKVHSLESNLNIVSSALAPLGERAFKAGGGAIYLWCKLPESVAKDDKEVVRWLAYKHGVCIIPGSACGAPGYVRVAFANLEEEQCRIAAGRLRKGLEELVNKGMTT